MPSYNDPTLRVRLTETVRGRVSRNYFGDKGYCDHQIGMTKIHLEQGLMFSQIGWGIDGLDNPVSPEVADFVDIYDLTHKVTKRAQGVYTLKDKKKVLARARVTDYRSGGEDVSEVIVSGKERKDVVKLYELIRDGKVRPDTEHEEFKQIEGALGELKRLQREIPALQQRLASRDATVKSLNEQLATVRHELVEAQTAAARK